MTHLHISVSAITRGTLARTHELKSEVLLARHVFCQKGLRNKGSRGHSGLRVVPGYFLRNSKASELLKRAKMTTRVSPSSRVAIFTRAGVIRLLYYS